ncbi:MAG TPA: diguanylate cyclase [Anaerolineales bacterium]|nr:diguanylate cyclase [Anaerolineales bacterium]
MEINIYLRTLQRGWWIIVLVMLAAMNFSLLISYFTPPVYETSSRFVVSPNAAVYSNSWDIVSSLDTLDRRSIINTYKELLASPAVYATSPEIQQITAAELAQYKIVVVVVPDTNILRLTVDGPDPKIVVLIAQAIGSQALDYINKLYPVYNFSVLDQPELPTKPIRPEPVKNAGLALLVGAILGMGLAFSREQLQFSFERLRERSNIDSVSSAYNRAYFERKLREEVTQNPDTNLSLGIINLRGIEERLNLFPQATIDRVINKVTQTLKSELRGRDIVGRWDRTQLSVMLPSAPSSAVESTFKRIQKYLEEPIQLNETGDIVRPDPRIGVVSRNQFESSDALMERAKSAVEQASSFGSPGMVYLSTPFIFDESMEKA